MIWGGGGVTGYSKNLVLGIAVAKLPCLLLCCRRWSGRNHREKIGVHVAFDQVLKIQPYCCRDSATGLHREGFTYDLSAVVMHHGKGFGSGHYTAYCYNSEGGEYGESQTFALLVKSKWISP